MTTNLNPLGNLLGAGRDARTQQQAFNNEMQIADLQLRAQAQSAHLNQIAGFGGQAGAALGAAFGQMTGGPITQSPPVENTVDPWTTNRGVREILQAEIDVWLAPVTL